MVKAAKYSVDYYYGHIPECLEGVLVAAVIGDEDEPNMFVLGVGATTITCHDGQTKCYNLSESGAVAPYINKILANQRKEGYTIQWFNAKGGKSLDGAYQYYRLESKLKSKGVPTAKNRPPGAWHFDPDDPKIPEKGSGITMGDGDNLLSQLGIADDGPSDVTKPENLKASAPADDDWHGDTKNVPPHRKASLRPKKPEEYLKELMR